MSKTKLTSLKKIGLALGLLSYLQLSLGGGKIKISSIRDRTDASQYKSSSIIGTKRGESTET